jgi:hypothetical protein
VSKKKGLHPVAAGCRPFFALTRCPKTAFFGSLPAYRGTPGGAFFLWQQGAAAEKEEASRMLWTSRLRISAMVLSVIVVLMLAWVGLGAILYEVVRADVRKNVTVGKPADEVEKYLRDRGISVGYGPDYTFAGVMTANPRPPASLPVLTHPYVWIDFDEAGRVKRVLYLEGEDIWP